MDIYNRQKRSTIMSRIGSKDTKPEILFRRMLHGLGYRFRLHRRDLPGIPDVVLPRHKTAVFVHGCFWHRHPGCKKSSVPEQNREFWLEKLTGNVRRDTEVRKQLESLGWNVIVVWECELKGNLAAVRENIHKLMEKSLPR